MTENDIRVVENVMEKRFSVILAEKTVAEARSKMALEQTSYIVLTDRSGNPIGLAGTHSLMAHNDQDILNDTVSNDVFIVEPQMTLDDALYFSAESLIEDPEMEGLVVEKEHRASGVLPREKLRLLASRITNGRGLGNLDITDIPGRPLSRAQYFTCPKGDYKRLVSFYNPSNPPICPKDGTPLQKEG